MATRIVLFDLAGAEDDRRFSPYCWRTKMALAHKGLAFDTRPWRFTEKDAIAFAGQKTVPVIVDGEETVGDSWNIAEYLERRYDDRPSLFGGAIGQGTARLVKFWVERTLHPLFAPMLLADVYDHVHEKDRDYFRSTREKAFGRTLEELKAGREDVRENFRRALEPLRQTLAAQPYVGGTAPAYVDYIVFGAFQWARSISDFKLLASDDPVYAWRDRMLDLFDGLARRAKGYPV